MWLFCNLYLSCFCDHAVLPITQNHTSYKPMWVYTLLVTIIVSVAKPCMYTWMYSPPFVNYMTIPMYIVQPCENIPHEWNHIPLQSCDYIPNIPPNSLIIGHSMNYTYTPLLNAGLYKTDAVATFQPIPDFIMHVYQYFPCTQYCDCILGNSPLLTSTEWMWRQR